MAIKDKVEWSNLALAIVLMHGLALLWMLGAGVIFMYVAYDDIEIGAYEKILDMSSHYVPRLVGDAALISGFWVVSYIFKRHVLMHLVIVAMVLMFLNIGGLFFTDVTLHRTFVNCAHIWLAMVAGYGLFCLFKHVLKLARP